MAVESKRDANHVGPSLADTASARGLKRIGGDVLAINEPMKVFAKAHGFALSRSHG